MTHLSYDLIGAFKCSETRHPQTVMRELGITYQHATPQSIADLWWFWNCSNVQRLPTFIKELELDPMKCVGNGLSQEGAERIRDGVAAIPTTK